MDTSFKACMVYPVKSLKYREFASSPLPSHFISHIAINPSLENSLQFKGDVTHFITGRIFNDKLTGLKGVILLWLLSWLIKSYGWNEIEAVAHHQGAPVLNQFYPCVDRHQILFDNDPLGQKKIKTQIWSVQHFNTRNNKYSTTHISLLFLQKEKSQNKLVFIKSRTLQLKHLYTGKCTHI